MSSSQTHSARRKALQRRSTVDSEDEYHALHESPAEDEDFAPSPPHKAVHGKSSMTAGVKKKSKREEKEITFKDERKLSAKEGNSTAHGSKRSRQDIEDVADPASDKLGSNTPEPNASMVPIDPINESEKEREPVTKKRKLPVIKKIKNTGSTSSTPAPPLKQDAAEGGKDKDSNPSLPSTLSRKPAATAGNADLDLTNKDVYKQLFSHGNAPPRSGIKEKEERIRQLNKMRDEARAKRTEEARNCFDLQAQHDKIIYFTKRLESRRSPAVWPNTLAAKFKAEHDERMRYESARGRSSHDHRQSNHQQNGWTT